MDWNEKTVEIPMKKEVTEVCKVEFAVDQNTDFQLLQEIIIVHTDETI